MGILLKYLPWQYNINVFQRSFMSLEYPVNSLNKIFYYCVISVAMQPLNL